MDSDLIKRGLAISYAVSGRVRRIDGEEWIRVSEVRQSINDVPTTPQPDFKDDYNQAIIDGKTNYSRPEGEWIDYDNTFYKCPECCYLLEKCCPECQTKVILPKGGAE